MVWVVAILIPIIIWSLHWVEVLLDYGGSLFYLLTSKSKTKNWDKYLLSLVILLFKTKFCWEISDYTMNG